MRAAVVAVRGLELARAVQRVRAGPKARSPLMQTATREEIIHVFGDLDDITVAALMGLDATLEDVQRAQEWILSRDIEVHESMVDPLVWKMLDILRDIEADEPVYEQ
jgi:hypothetical protein